MTLTPEAKRAGFVGTGIMGRHMAGHIMAGGWQLHVFNRTRAKAEPLIEAGAIWEDSPGEVAAKTDVVFTMLGYPADVEQVYLGGGSLIERGRPGTVLIDMSTSSPILAGRIADAAEVRRMKALDAPVSGGDVGARDATLAIMVGGDEEAFEAVLPVLQLMGTNINHMGVSGAGQHTKMANQVIIASTLMGVCEGLIYARQQGLDPRAVLAAIGSGAAGSFQLNVLGPKMIEGDFAPGFYVDHFIKDLEIAAAEAERGGFDLPGLSLVRDMMVKVRTDFGAELGTQALFRKYDS